MEIVLFVEGGKLRELEERLFRDEVVSRANIILRDSRPFREGGFYVRVLGSEEQCNRARNLTQEIAEEVLDKEREEVLKVIKEEDERMLSGFSSIFR
ncbi:MAG: hypothetical protein ABDH32_01670 [Candidatus Caldarchaeales archaeon]